MKVLTPGKYNQALRKYNEIMEYLCLEHNTIGTKLSEDTDDWNLRDMVAECDYQLSTYYERGHVNCDMKYEDNKTWLSETGKLKRFINHWAPYCYGIKCASGHCSRFDNYRTNEGWEAIPKEYME